MSWYLHQLRRILRRVRKKCLFFRCFLHGVRPLLGEPYIRERTFAPHWLTENAERESARRFFVSPFTSRLSEILFGDARLSGSKRNTGCRVEMPLFGTMPVPNGPKLSDSLVYRGL
jgi:hypothetical protein